MRKLLLSAAALASTCCLLGGVWILAHSTLSKNDVLSVGIGLYFVGKAVFVGSILLVAASRVEGSHRE